MANKSGFPIVAAIAAAIAVAMLIFLFTVPGNYLRDMTAKLRVMTHEAEQAAVLGDMATAAERLDAITREYNLSLIHIFKDPKELVLRAIQGRGAQYYWM